MTHPSAPTGSPGADQSGAPAVTVLPLHLVQYHKSMLTLTQLRLGDHVVYEFLGTFATDAEALDRAARILASALNGLIENSGTLETRDIDYGPDPTEHGFTPIG